MTKLSIDRSSPKHVHKSIWHQYLMVCTILKSKDLNTKLLCRAFLTYFWTFGSFNTHIIISLLFHSYRVLAFYWIVDTLSTYNSMKQIECHWQFYHLCAHYSSITGNTGAILSLHRRDLLLLRSNNFINKLRHVVLSVTVWCIYGCYAINLIENQVLKLNCNSGSDFDADSIPERNHQASTILLQKMDLKIFMISFSWVLFTLGANSHLEILRISHRC